MANPFSSKDQYCKAPIFWDTQMSKHWLPGYLIFILEKNLRPSSLKSGYLDGIPSPASGELCDLCSVLISKLQFLPLKKRTLITPITLSGCKNKMRHVQREGASLVVQLVKNLPASARDLGSIPGSGRSPGEGNGYPPQYSCLENSMDRGAWQATIHGVTKSWTQLSD